MKYRHAIIALLLCAMLSGTALAAETSLPWDQVYCFSQADFETRDGILLTAVPEPDLGLLRLGSRTVKAGDALTAEQLTGLVFEPAGNVSGDAVIACVRLTEDGPSDGAMTLKIRKNQPPSAEDSQFQTYRNIPGQVPLTVSDPEGSALTVTIVKAPRRGDVKLSEDGSVVYTPRENKVGKDSFVYTVTDEAGNVSREATVRIDILKPSDKEVYCDLSGDPALLAATWLRENGIYSGHTVGESLLFGPEEPVTRGEFIAMCAELLGQDPEAEPLESGFADEIPAWLRPYVSTALQCGFLQGVPGQDGLLLEAGKPVTHAQAAAMLGSMLGLSPEASPVMGDLTAASSEVLPLSRRDAAQLLYGAAQYSAAHSEAPGLLAWAAR